MISYNDFIKWEDLDKDVIKVKRMYVDITEDLIAGLLLSQIIYWHLPSKQGGLKLRVKKEGHLWLAKSREDWWEECRISPKQFDRAIQILIDKGFIDKQLFRFNGSPTVHIRVIEDVLMDSINSILTKGENGNSPKGKMETDETVKTLTETTTENTTEITIDAENQASTNEDQDLSQENIKEHTSNEDCDEVTPDSEDLEHEEEKAPMSDFHLGHLAKDSKRMGKLKERFNKSVPDLIAWDKERVRKGENNKSKGGKSKSSPRNSSVIIARFKELYNSFFGETCPMIEIKHKKLMKTMIDHYGYDYTEEMLVWMFEHWAEFKRECNIKSTPNLSILYSFRDYLQEKVRTRVEQSEELYDF